MDSIETYENQMRDSDMIFKQIMTAGYDNFDQVNRIICMLYIPDITISRSGISHALKRINNLIKRGEI